MQLRELKDWIAQLPPEMDSFEIVNGEVGIIDEQYYYRVDKPITTLTVDNTTNEILFLNDTQDDVKPNEAPDDAEEDELVKIFKSDEFREKFKKQVEEDTWGKGLPMYYMDKEGWLVEHHKDGTINQLKKLK